MYVLKQIASKSYLEPIYDLQKEITDVDVTLSEHQCTINTPISRMPESSDAAQKALMKNSSELHAKLNRIPHYPTSRIQFFGKIPPKESVEEAVATLRGLSTHMHETGDKAMKSLDQVRLRVQKIRRLLRLKPLE